MVEDKTLKVDIWSAIRSALVGKVYVSNLATTTTTGASIVATYNDDYPTKPIVEIMPLRVEELFDEFNNIQGNKDIAVTINCYYKNSLGVDQMDDQITDILKTTKIDGISLRSIYSDYGIPLTPNDNKYHIKSLSISYNRK
jgi:hypothetical protein